MMSLLHARSLFAPRVPSPNIAPRARPPAMAGNFWLVYHDLLESDEEVALDWSAPLHCPYPKNRLHIPGALTSASRHQVGGYSGHSV